MSDLLEGQIQWRLDSPDSLPPSMEDRGLLVKAMHELRRVRALGHEHLSRVEQLERDEHITRDQLRAAEARVKEMERVLCEIADDPHQSYDMHSPSRSAADDQYKMGIADGHRCAGSRARTALAQPSDESGGGKEGGDV